MKKSSRTYVNLAGQIGSGKTKLSESIREDLGLVPFSVSGLLVKNALENGRTLVERKDYREEQRLYLREFGRRAILDQIEATSGLGVIVDGLRVPEFAFELREVGPNSIIIALPCPEETRLKRVLERERQRGNTGKDKLTGDGFRIDETEDHEGGPLGNNMGLIMNNADYEVDASRSFPEVLERVEALIIPHMPLTPFD